MSREAPEDRSGIAFRRLVGRRSVPLLAASAGVGLASAAYWTFSTELVVRAGDIGQTGATVFWVVLGVFGLAGGLAGDLSQRFGIGTSLGAALLAMAGAIGLLAVAPGVPLLAYASAALFGTTYIMLTGILLVWSVGVFAEQPSAGLGISFLLLAAGQVLGSSLAGILAGAIDLRMTFLVFAGVAALAAGAGIWTGDTGDARGSAA